MSHWGIQKMVDAAVKDCDMVDRRGAAAGGRLVKVQWVEAEEVQDRQAERLASLGKLPDEARHH